MNSSKKPEVSIITVTKNRADLLERAIESVLAQTFTEFEYIIIDGASTDHTTQVVQSFNDKRIVYKKLEEDLSPSVLCIDYAVNLSEGNYITFLDDDDEYLPKKIEKQYNLLKSLPEEYGCVYCWMDYYDAKTNKMIKEHHPAIRGNIFHECIEKQSIGGTPTLFLKKKVYLEINGWNKDLNYTTDWEFNTRIARKYLIDFVPEVLVKVHIHHAYHNMNLARFDEQYKNNILNTIQLHEYFLSEFKDGFTKYPRKKMLHMITLAKCYARLRNFKKCKKLLVELVDECGINFLILVTILKSVYFFISGVKFKNA
jgi:glycosyltransferase involved in cell wall biosynthesis